MAAPVTDVEDARDALGPPTPRHRRTMLVRILEPGAGGRWPRRRPRADPADGRAAQPGRVTDRSRSPRPRGSRASCRTRTAPGGHRPRAVRRTTSRARPRRPRAPRGASRSRRRRRGRGASSPPSRSTRPAGGDGHLEARLREDRSITSRRSAYSVAVRRVVRRRAGRAPSIAGSWSGAAAATVRKSCTARMPAISAAARPPSRPASRSPSTTSRAADRHGRSAMPGSVAIGVRARRRRVMCS